MRQLTVIGIGPGAARYVPEAAAEAIREADCVAAPARHLPLAAGCGNVIELRDFESAFASMEAEEGRVAVLVSGDPGLYSLLPLLKRRFSDVPLRVIPGISSLQYLCAATGEAWQDAAILSGHGRPLGAAEFLNTVERNRLTALFCGGEWTPRRACETLSNAIGDLGERVTVMIGERLSYQDERITSGAPADLARGERDFAPLSLMLARNAEPYVPPRRPRDCDFEREAGIPMTNGEVRSILIDRLGLAQGSVFWDIGAGTGSVSVAAALVCPGVEVHAVERSRPAISLLERNRAKFRLHNMKIYEATAVSAMDSLPEPSHVFIGGSGGELKDILGKLAAYANVRVCVSAVTLNTLSAAFDILGGAGWSGLEAVQVSASQSRPLGTGLLMSACNPVTLLFANSSGDEGMMNR